jgi:hypothetical protein
MLRAGGKSIPFTLAFLGGTHRVGEDSTEGLDTDLLGLLAGAFVKEERFFEEIGGRSSCFFSS